MSNNTNADLSIVLNPDVEPSIVVPEDNTWITRNDFPPDFIFGTATSAYQVEGAAAKGGRGPSIWDSFCLNTPGKIADGSNGNVAVDMYNMYEQDIKAMKRMGFDAYRFSVSWPRILPGGKVSMGVNREGIDYYNRIIDTCIANDIIPFVTIFHWDVPQILQDEYGGFLSYKIVEDLRSFAEVCFWEFGDRVKNWITLNEAYTFATSGYVLDTFPPGNGRSVSSEIHPTCRGHVSNTTNDSEDSNNTNTINLKNTTSTPEKDAYTVGRNLLLAHAEIYHTYRRKFKEFQGGQVGITNNSSFYEPLDENNPEDVAAADRALQFMLGWFTEPLVTGNYPHIMTDLVHPETLVPFSRNEMRLLKGSYDFYGLNYYTAKYVFKPTAEQKAQLPAFYQAADAGFTDERDNKKIGELSASWLYVVPWGLYKLLKFIKDTYQDFRPIYITENGCNQENNYKLTAQEACVDPVRTKYYQDHLAYLRAAMGAPLNINVKGYFAWSWCDNFEWNEGYTIRFGLMYVDYKNNLTRYPKQSAVWFAKFLKKKKHLLLGSKRGLEAEDEHNTETDDGIVKKLKG